MWRIKHSEKKIMTSDSTAPSTREMLLDMLTEEVVRGQEPARIRWLAEKFCEISPQELSHMDLVMVLLSVQNTLRRSRIHNSEET